VQTWARSKPGPGPADAQTRENTASPKAAVSAVVEPAVAAVCQSWARRRSEWDPPQVESEWLRQQIAAVMNVVVVMMRKGGEGKITHMTAAQAG
jgi:hypothetical protein